MNAIAGLLVGAALSACGATIPAPTTDSAAPVRQLGRQIHDTQRATQQSVSVLARQVGALGHDVQLAAQKSEMAVEAVEREARNKPSVVVREKIVPVADPVFSTQDRDDLLTRAADQLAKLDETAAHLRALAERMDSLRRHVSELQALRESPVSFVRTHGVSGALMAVLSGLAYALGLKRKR